MSILTCRERNATHDVLSHFENSLQSLCLTSYSSSKGNLKIWANGLYSNSFLHRNMKFLLKLTKRFVFIRNTQTFFFKLLFCPLIWFFHISQSIMFAVLATFSSIPNLLQFSISNCNIEKHNAAGLAFSFISLSVDKHANVAFQRVYSNSNALSVYRRARNTIITRTWG